MKQFEYRLAQMKDAFKADAFNAVGSDGWEVACFWYNGSGGGTALLQREKQPEPQGAPAEFEITAGVSTVSVDFVAMSELRSRLQTCRETIMDYAMGEAMLETFDLWCQEQGLPSL